MYGVNVKLAPSEVIIGLDPKYKIYTWSTKLSNSERVENVNWVPSIQNNVKQPEIGKGKDWIQLNFPLVVFPQSSETNNIVKGRVEVDYIILEQQ